MTASVQVLSPGALSTGEAVSRVALSVQAGSTTAGGDRAVNLEEGNPPLLALSPCHGQSLLPSFITCPVPIARLSGHLTGESHALGTLQAEDTCPWWVSATRPTQG